MIEAYLHSYSKYFQKMKLLLKDADQSGKIQGAAAEFGLPETVRETFPNTDKLAGTFVVYCIGDEIEIKARGLSPRQLLKIFGLLISKMF